MKEFKKIWILLSFALLFVSIFAACGKTKKEYLVTISTQGEYYQKGFYEIYHPEQGYIIKDSENNIHEYEDGSTIHIRIKADLNHHIVEKNLGFGILASSKSWFDASPTKKEEISVQIQNRISEIRDMELSEEESLKLLEKDATYSLYSPVEIKWEKVTKTEYIGKVKVTKHIVFEILGNVFAKDTWTVYTMSNSPHFNYSVNYNSAQNMFESERKSLNLTASVTTFEIEESLFYLKVKNANVNAENFKVTKMHFIFMSEPKSNITKEDVLNSEYKLEGEFAYMKDTATDEDYYVSTHISFPEYYLEEFNPNPFTDEFRYVIIFVEVEPLVVD